MPNTPTKPIKYKRSFESEGGLLLKATPMETHHAALIARIRSQGHDHTRKPCETIGKPLEQAIAEHYGALAEVVVLGALYRADMVPQDYVLTAERAPIGPDFILNGRSYQVKAVKPNNRYLCVNEKQRLDPRHVSDYVFPVVFVAPTVVRVLRPIPYATVGTWRLMCDHSEYRSVDIYSLFVLNSLNELTS